MDIEDAIDHARDWSKKYITGLVSRINQKSLDIYGESIIEPKQINGMLHYKIRDTILGDIQKEALDHTKGFFEKTDNINIIIVIAALVIVYKLMRIFIA